MNTKFVSLFLVTLAFTTNAALAADSLTPLHNAAIKGDGATLKALLLGSADVNARDKYGWTPLHCAAQHGHAHCIQTLLDAGADIKARNNVNRTPLHIAFLANEPACVQILIRNGADVDARDKWNKTPSMLASEPQKTVAQSHWTYLHHSAYYGHYEILQETFASADSFNLQCNINLKCKSCQGCTPLHLASMQGHLQCVQLLLNNKADINAQNNNDDTPLHLAAYSGQLACVQRLVQYGASLTIRNDQNKTPAMLAAKEGYYNIVNYLNATPAE